MQKKWSDKGVQVIGVTQHGREAAAGFMNKVEGNYPIIFDGEALREKFGINMLWGTVAILVDPEGKVVSDTLLDIDSILEEKLG